MTTQINKIVVMGLGYIGLPTASMLATKGFEVLGVDINESIVNKIMNGEIHIVEPDLDILVKSATKCEKLKASLSPDEADVFIIAVPTPFKCEDGLDCKNPDLSYVENATKMISPFLRQNNLIILESTSPVGTTEFVAEIIKKERPDLCSGIDNHISLHIAHCPERVLPGQIIRELVDNDRIIGGIDKISAEKAKSLYRTFCNGKIYLTDCRTAELAKLAENSFRDVNIAFANELSLICEKFEINIWELIELANRHPRVKILNPGPGVGGHCIAVDPWFIVNSAPDEANLIKTAREVNDKKPKWVIDRVKAIAGRFKKPVIGCLGLAFKPNVDDLRESPALRIVRKLIADNIGEIIPCEPNCNNCFNEFRIYGISEVIRKSDILVFLVSHDEFKCIKQESLKDKIVIDTCGIWK